MLWLVRLLLARNADSQGDVLIRPLLLGQDSPVRSPIPSLAWSWLTDRSVAAFAGYGYRAGLPEEL